MALILSMVVLAAFTFLVLHLWDRLTDAEQAQRWFWRWYLKGVATPLGLWLVLGLGAMPGLPGVIPLPPGGRSVLDLAAAGVLIIASYWAGLTLVWLVATVSPQVPAENHPRRRGLWLIWSVPLVPVAAFVAYALGWGGAGLAATLWLLPVAHGLVSLRTVPRKTPLYSSAIAKMKFGKFDEAEWEIIRQLEQCEEDFQGWLMLAELYACHFDDLAGAARIVRDLGEQPSVSPSDLSVALHKLADWHLQFGEDPDAARRALREISVRFPDTLLDYMARQRIDQLPASTEELRERRKPRLIALPKRGAAATPTPAPTDEVTRDDARAAADDCVKALERDPNDVPARERFARLLAERLERAEVAVNQLELLLDMPNSPPAKQTEWLALMAHWQLKFLGDLPAGRRTLQRLVTEFSQTGAAFEAQRRICLLDVEERFRRNRSTPEPRPPPPIERKITLG